MRLATNRSIQRSHAISHLGYDDDDDDDDDDETHQGRVQQLTGCWTAHPVEQNGSDSRYALHYDVFDNSFRTTNVRPT